MKCVQEHCSICNRELAMPVVQEDEKHPGLLWVRCPVCREVKPVEIGSRTKTAEQTEDGPASAAADDEGPHHTVRHYRAGERFCTGEWIYHPGWNDTGQVVEKCSSTGGREIIVVAFEKSGVKQLVSNFAG